MRFFEGDKEKKLVKRLRNGEPEAMKDFYDLFAGYLSGVCSRFIDNDDDLKDVFQDTLIKIISSIDKFEYRGDGSLQSWAKRIAVNQALDFLKQKKRIDTVALDNDVYDEAESDDPDIRDIPPDVIHDMLRHLPTGYRTVFNLYVIENKSHKEIAGMLNIKEASSASQLHRAKNILAAEIKRYRTNKDLRQ